VLERVRRIHLVGVGGIGMSGIAGLLVSLGYDVSGSDLRRSAQTARLERLGVRVDQGHAAGQIGAAELVVVSAAVPADNPERRAAETRGIPVVTRGAALAALTELRRTIAVVGSHGKTTVTAMIAHVLDQAGRDPTVVIGGILSGLGSNARLGSGPLMVVEADESDRSFLELSPEIAVLTNIDDEHLETYDGPAGLERAFVTFARQVSTGGTVVACVDDPAIRRIAPAFERDVLTYGFDPSADVTATDVSLAGSGTRCRLHVTVPDTAHQTIDLRLAVPGRHNAQNALAAVAAASRVGVAPPVTADALATFTGADRRFQIIGVVGGVTVIDDYAHHPTEIAAVLATARLRAPRRLVAVFQPHRYSRTARLLGRFADVLATADVVLLTDVYAAGETPIAGVTAEAVAEAIRRASTVPVRVVGAVEEVPAAVCAVAGRDDIVVTLGAGSIGAVAPRILDALGRAGEGTGA
jgi:UDP-N-acetylmuramate--alanine ligase